MIKLRGMTWDHERGYGPLLAVTKEYQKHHPDVEVEWVKRSLKDFGDYPVDKLAKMYDLIMIDHPHVGICLEQGVLVPLDEWVGRDFLDDQKRNSVGASHDSYVWQGRQWALAADAAAQVSAYREDLMEGRPLPQTWGQVVDLARSLPGGVKVGFPLCPTDAICSYITLCYQFGGAHFFDEQRGIDPSAGEEAAAILLRLLPHLHPDSLDRNPIQQLDAMASNDEVAYVPLLFGYSNYSRTGVSGNRILFTDIPSTCASPQGSILGGVGIAVSASSKHIEAAVRFAEYTASGDIQKTVYYRGGGQPAHRSAWQDPEVNRDSRSFFENTLRTLQLSYLRPRHKQFPAFQEQSGGVLNALLRKSKQGRAISPKEIVEALNKLYQQILSLG